MNPLQGGVIFRKKVFIADITMKGMDAYKKILTYELKSLWFKWQALGKYTSTIFGIKFIGYNNYAVWKQNYYIRWYYMSIAVQIFEGILKIL